MCTHHNKAKFITETVLELLSAYKRVLPGRCQHKNDIDCCQPHFNKIYHLVDSGKPIEFVLPAFPAKSANPNKTAGVLPDMGERLALRFLNQLCQQIKSFYEPGAHIVICSDGHVFNDLLDIEDEQVDAYTNEIKNMIAADSLQYITTFHLDDHYLRSTQDEMRTKLTLEYAESLTHLKQSIKNIESQKIVFNGIHRFIFEDYLSMTPVLSRNKVRGITKEIAYAVVRRSQAWSKLVEASFPEAVRLSIHPQLCGSEKLGIMLLKSNDAWATPWHRVAMHDGDEFVLIRKRDAEALNAISVFKNNNFSHYKLETRGEAQ